MTNAAQLALSSRSHRVENAVKQEMKGVGFSPGASAPSNHVTHPPAASFNQAGRSASSWLQEG